MADGQNGMMEAQMTLSYFQLPCLILSTLYNNSAGEKRRKKVHICCPFCTFNDAVWIKAQQATVNSGCWILPQIWKKNNDAADWSLFYLFLLFPVSLWRGRGEEDVREITLFFFPHFPSRLSAGQLSWYRSLCLDLHDVIYGYGTKRGGQ